MMRSTQRLTLIIREARSGDIPALASLERQAFSEPWSEASLTATLQEPHCSLLVAREKRTDSLLGAVLLRHLGDEAELLRISVRPDRRRHGVARRLMDAAMQELAASAAKRCVLEVRRDNDAARELYLRSGARRIATRERYYADGTDAIIYELAVPPSHASQRSVARP